MLSYDNINTNKTYPYTIIGMENQNICETISNGKIESENGIQQCDEPAIDDAIAPNIQIHGGCGLGAVVLLNKKPPKVDDSDAKIKEEGMPDFDSCTSLN